MDIVTCLQQKELEIRDRCGYVPDDATFEEDEGSEGKSGAIRSRIWMTNDAYFDIYEAIEIVDESYARRRVYSYALIVDGRITLRSESIVELGPAAIQERFLIERRHAQPIR